MISCYLYFKSFGNFVWLFLWINVHGTTRSAYARLTLGFRQWTVTFLPIEYCNTAIKNHYSVHACTLFRFKRFLKSLFKLANLYWRFSVRLMNTVENLSTRSYEIGIFNFLPIVKMHDQGFIWLAVENHNWKLK